jgi:CO/xanthine dehydrogenase FAD-binding subunit
MRKDNIAVFFPKNLNDLLSIYSSNPEAEILAGALEFMNNSNVTQIKKIISITSVSELKKVHRTDKYIDLGAATTISQILRIGQYVIPPILYNALKSIGSPSIRNIATIGGNILQSSIISNSLPVLCALNAGFELRNLSKSRWLPASQFITNDKKNILNKDEVLVRIRIPLTFWHTQIFKKVTLKSNIYPAQLIFCGLAHIAKSIISDMKIVLGRPNKSLFRNRSIETYFIGKKLPISDKDIKQLTEILDDTLEQVEDTDEKEFYLRNTTIRLIVNFFKELKQ